MHVSCWIEAEQTLIPSYKSLDINIRGSISASVSPKRVASRAPGFKFIECLFQLESQSFQYGPTAIHEI